MLTDNNVANHGAPVGSDSRSQTSSQQGDARPGPKSASAGTNGAKVNQLFGGNSGLKAAGQTLSGAGGMLKTKTKRERSISTDSETRNAASVCVELDVKGEGVMRSKRRCVLEKKQPYSGDEWCSGPDTEDDEDKPPRATAATQRGRGQSGPLLGNPDCLPKGSGLPESGVPSLVCGPGLKAELPTSPQTMYIFTTSLANSAADAVLKGKSDSILQYHQQNVPGAKLEQELSSRKLSDKISVSSPSAMSKPPMGSQHLPMVGGRLHDPESSVTRRSATPAGPGAADDEGRSESPSVLAAHLEGEGGPRMALSREQLEHRQRSLQTLRDIERLFLRSEAGGGGPGDPGVPNNNMKHMGGPEDGDNTPENMVLSGLSRMKSHEEPLQSMISQTQSLSGPGPDSPQMDPQNHLAHHQLSSPGSDMVHMLGPEGLTPEQVAWRKLQEEYYQEKRRMQEIQPSSHQLRLMGEMPGGPMVMRGPPPPYHSKPGEWAPGHMMGGGQLDIQQEGPRGPKFLGQMQQRPGRGDFPGSPGGVLSMEGQQRTNRSGMVWIDDIPNTVGVGGPFPGYYPGRSPQQVQGEPEHLLTREEIFHIMEKRQRLSKQQQMGLSGRIMEGQDFANVGMGRPDHMDFHGPRDMMCPSGGGPQMRDLVNPMGGNMGPQMSLQQQQSMILFQRLRGGPQGGGALGELFNQEGLRLQTHGDRGKGMMEGFAFQGPFSRGPMDGPFPQQGPEMFDHSSPMGGTPQLSHMQQGGHRGPDVGPRHPSDLNVNVHPLASPSGPFPRQLKSPSMNQAPSPQLSSPSGPGIKSPPHMAAGAHHPSRAGTPSSTSMKAPQVSLGMPSPSVSPGRLKSPAMAGSSPGWASPKTALPSPGGPRVLGNNSETGQSLPPPTSSNSAPVSQPGSLNPTFTSSPVVAPSQNPLSLIMSQMSKYAMPSTTPLYHDAIKTIATSDDEMLPDRPLLSNVQIGGSMGNPHISQTSLGDPQSPLGIVSQGQQQQQQQLPLDASGSGLPPANHMGLPSMNPANLGGPDGMGPCNMSPMSQNQMGGFPRMQPPPHRQMHSPVGMSQDFPPPDEALLTRQQLHLLSKGHRPQRHPSDLFPMGGDGPDLSEVIRTSHSGIPEFDLSRIIPSDKPSSTLQYFPKSEPPAGPPTSNPHLANLQNMMADQQLPPHLSHGGVRQSMAMLQGGPRGMGGPMCGPPPGHMMVRTGMMQPQPGMMANSLLHHGPPNSYGMMSPQQQHSLMTRQNIMMLQAKQRGMQMPVESFGPHGPLLSPQGGAVMAPQHPQSGLIGPPSLRQRGMSLDSPVGFGPPGGMTNMPF